MPINQTDKTRQKNFLEELVDVEMGDTEHQMKIEDNEKTQSDDVSENRLSWLKKILSTGAC